MKCCILFETNTHNMKPIYLFKAAFIAGFALLSNSTQAQMVGGDVFLKGQYVEVGIGHLGYYGSDATAPTGFHSHPSGSKLGFVADLGMDGWGTGTPAYMGDYFTPGTPFEGWALDIDTMRCRGYNTGSSGSSLLTNGPACSGANLSYTTSGTKVIGTWQGVFDSVAITQITTLDTTQLYFTVKVILTNTAVAPKNNIYYLRSLDPDNDQSWPGGGFATHNKVEYQSHDTTIVSATGYSSSAPYLGLGTTDTGATAVIYNSWPISITASLAAAYNGTMSGSYIGPVGTDHPGDIAVGIVMYIPHLATVDSAGDSVYRTTATPTLHAANTATINYFYAFSAAGQDSALTYLNTPPLHGTLAVTNVNNAEIAVYPNPSRDAVSVTGLASTDRIMLYDMMGRQASQNWNVTHEGTNTFRYNDLPTGAYILIVTDAQGQMKTRVPIRKL